MHSFLKAIIPVMLITLISTSPSMVIASDPVSIESNIIFNTSCAQCHEGECSGRLSFNLPQSAADQHILRHGGELSKETIKQLFELLRYMKEECGYYPFPFSLIKDRIWNSNMLAKFHSLSNKAYFIPLGHLEPGTYQLVLDGVSNINGSCIEIISDEFDYIEKENLNGSGEQQRLQFHVEDRSGHYLRISANRPISINRLELELAGEKPVNNGH